MHDPFGLVGQVLDGQFRVDQYVGEGGFSVVYKGHHLGLSAPVALKCLKLPASLQPSLIDSFVQRFRDESRLYYQLSQGNLSIVRSISSGTTTVPESAAVLPYMVLEWLEGRSLAQDFEERRTKGLPPRTLDEAFELFAGAADGLGYAHAQGVVHRDMNPGNIFIVEDKGHTRTKVLDFGVAKILRDHTLELGARAQTLGAIRIFAPAYGAPEQFDDRVGEVGPWTDIYGFSLMLLESMLGKCVSEGEHIGDFARNALDEDRRPTPRTLGLDVPDEIEQVFIRSFKINPKERWQNAQDFWVVFRNAVRMARHKGFNALSTVPLSMGFLKQEIDKGKDTPKDDNAKKEAQNKTLAMAAMMAPTPLAPHVAPQQAPQGPSTHRLSAVPGSALNATLAMPQRPSGLPAPPSLQTSAASAASPATHPLAGVPAGVPSGAASGATASVPAAAAQTIPGVTNGPAAVVDDPSARAGYDDAPAPPMNGGGKVGLIVAAVVVGLLVLGGVGVALVKLARSPARPDVTPSATVSAGAAPTETPSSTPSSPSTTATSSTAATPVADNTSPSSSPSSSAAPTDSATTAPSASVAAQPASPTSTATQAPAEPTSHPTSQPGAPPTAHPSAAPVDPNAFNEKAARAKLDTFGGILDGACHDPNGVTGPGLSHVTFGADGKITQITVDPPYAGTKQGTCAIDFLKRAVAPAFVGPPVTIAYKFSVAK